MSSVCSEVSKRLSITFRLWGINLTKEQLSALCSLQETTELRKGESIDVGPANVVLFLDGIFEISRLFFTAGDVLYIEHGGKVTCISHEGRLSMFRKRDLEDVLGLAVADRLCRAAKFVESEESEDVPVSFFIRRVPVVGTSETTIQEAVKMMRDLGISSIVLVDDEDRPTGIMTDTDLRKVIADQIPFTERLAKVATRPVHFVRENESASTVLERMLLLGVKHMVIVDRDCRICGVTTLRDLYDAYTAVPLSFVRELQRSGDLDELKLLYSRVLKQVLNVVSRRKVDVDEFSRNFSLLRVLTLSRALAFSSSDLADKVVVLVGGSLLTYDHIFGEDLIVRVLGADDSSVVDVVKRLRRSVEMLLDLREATSIDMYTMKDLLSSENPRLLSEIIYFSRPIWGSTRILDEISRLYVDSLLSHVPSLVREYCERIDIPLDFFKRLKVRTVNLYRDLIQVMEKLLYYAYIVTARSRPAIKVHRIVDFLAEVKAIDDNLARSVKLLYDELKQLALKIAVREYIEKLQPTAQIDIEYLSDSELRCIVQGFETLRDLADAVRDIVSRYTAL